MGRWPTGTERITSRVVIDAAGCWNWTGGSHTSDGYGQLTDTYAHRLSYELFVGSIPNGYQVDHLCNNTSCVNPAHLEPVTRAENMRRVALRRTHCKNNHEFTPANTYMRPGGARQCRQCNAAAARRYKARTATALSPAPVVAAAGGAR